jgi:hypothetical protein
LSARACASASHSCRRESVTFRGCTYPCVSFEPLAADVFCVLNFPLALAFSTKLRELYSTDNTKTDSENLRQCSVRRLLPNWYCVLDRRLANGCLVLRTLAPGIFLTPAEETVVRSFWRCSRAVQEIAFSIDKDLSWTSPKSPLLDFGWLQ